MIVCFSECMCFAKEGRGLGTEMARLLAVEAAADKVGAGVCIPCV